MADLVQVGWMISDELAAELDLDADDGYICTLKQVADDGGLKPEYVGRLVPVYALRRVDGSFDLEAHSAQDRP